MTLVLTTLAPALVGPVSFLLGGLLVIALIVLVARIAFGVAWTVVAIAVVIAGVLWLLSAGSPGPPGLG